MRSIQRCNAKSRQESIIVCDLESILFCIETALAPLFKNDQGRTVCLGLSFDGTKTPAKLQLSTAYKAIIGGATPKEMIPIADKSQDEVKELIVNKDEAIVLAQEVKVAVMTIQNSGNRISPYAVIAAQPQTLNAVTEFNQIVTNSVLSWCKSCEKKSPLLLLLQME